MAKKKSRRSAPKMRDVLGRFSSKRLRPIKRRKARRTTRTASYNRKPRVSSNKARSGQSSTRLLTILGVGAAAILLTKKLTSPTQTPYQASQPRLLSAPKDTVLRSGGPTMPDGAIV